MYCKSSSILISILLLKITNASKSINIKCKYDDSSWASSIGKIYQCEVKSDMYFTERGYVIEKVDGVHGYGKNDADVKGFHYENKVTLYMPRGIEAFFENLIGLSIARSELVEITQTDLKAFPKLKHLYIVRNQIEYLEANLFKHNPDLVYVSFDGNKIKEIHSTAFANLNLLEALELDDNICIKKKASGRNGVIKLIEKLEAFCKMEDKPKPLIKNDENIEELNGWSKLGIVLTASCVILAAAIVGIFLYKKYNF